MQIFVKTLEGKSVALDVKPTDKVECALVSNVPQEEQRLLFAGKQLDVACTFSDYNIGELCTVELALRLLGGAKKRKKKNYSTPKKMKHKKKKVKMAVLEFYKVDDSGKVSRTRRECPSEQCGAGVFMAAMEDRHYCGKCSYTLVFSKPE